MKDFFFILLMILLFSCGKRQDTNTQNQEELDTIEQDSIKTDTLQTNLSEKELINLLVQDIPEIKLPFYWDQNSAFKTVNPESYNKIIPELQIVGYIDMHDKYAIVQLVPADELYPQVTIIDTNGRTLDSKSIIIGRCHGDCSYQCNESTKIDRNLDIYARFNSVYQECDGSGKIDPLQAEASILEGFGKLTKSGKIEFREEPEKTYKPDSAEVSTLGFNSEVFQIIDHDYVETLKIKQVNDSTINYWIHSDNDLCEFSYYGTAIKTCQLCDGEIDEYKGEAYASFEYFPNGQVDIIESIRIAQDYTKAILKPQENVELDDCMPWMGHVILNVSR